MTHGLQPCLTSFSVPLGRCFSSFCRWWLYFLKLLCPPMFPSCLSLFLILFFLWPLSVPPPIMKGKGYGVCCIGLSFLFLLIPLFSVPPPCSFIFFFLCSIYTAFSYFSPVVYPSPYLPAFLFPCSFFLEVFYPHPLIVCWVYFYLLCVTAARQLGFSLPLVLIFYDLFFSSSDFTSLCPPCTTCG